MDQDVFCQFFSFNGITLAVRHRKGACSPGLVVLPGYRANMLGDKATAIDSFAKKITYLVCVLIILAMVNREEIFFQGTISRWVEESLAVFEAYCEGPQILIGSSMGGWIAMRLATLLAQQGKEIAGIVLIAPATDFTDALIKPVLKEVELKDLEEKGYCEVPLSEQSEPLPFTKILLEDGKNNSIMNGCLDVKCPIHILQGMEDEPVPYQHSMDLLDHLPLNDVTLTLVRDADHNFSRPKDLDCLERVIMSLIN
ncbi:2-hydroxymuconic semialdehyde hydrolase [Bartonella ancashensis]|uniref:2-hydroxymuconic semialdehyde hydrolase n=1 Tax=Bartonella ancashensis TaxID=1318743 RepID=A0A0M3T2R6_9HYPH|nr:2-hydroxymuconic semialdehyde hydrolase [Bartonella ancashensis]